MVHVYIKRWGCFIGAVLLQVLILNHIHIAGYATPYLYVYFILTFNTGVSRNVLMAWGFLLGLLIDIFSSTPGLNAAATVLLAFVCQPVLRLFSPKELENVVPGFGSLGVEVFVKYVAVVVLLHHAVLLGLEAFSFLNWPGLLLKVVLSSLLSIICILSVESFRR